MPPLFLLCTQREYDAATPEEQRAWNQLYLQACHPNGSITAARKMMIADQRDHDEDREGTYR